MRCGFVWIKKPGDQKADQKELALKPLGTNKSGRRTNPAFRIKMSAKTFYSVLQKSAGLCPSRRRPGWLLAIWYSTEGHSTRCHIRLVCEIRLSICKKRSCLPKLRSHEQNLPAQRACSFGSNPTGIDKPVRTLWNPFWDLRRHPAPCHSRPSRVLPAHWVATENGDRG